MPAGEVEQLHDKQSRRRGILTGCCAGDASRELGWEGLTGYRGCWMQHCMCATGQLHGWLMRHCGSMTEMSAEHGLLTKWQSLAIVLLHRC